MTTLILDFRALLETLFRHGVRFIVVGGVAAVLHGAPITTFDLDVVHARDLENLHRLHLALQDLGAYYRGPGNQRLEPKKEDLAHTGHHLLMTRLGPLDLLGSIGKDHDFEALIPHTELMNIGTMTLLVLRLEKLIAIKEEVGHEKDLMTLPVLKQILRVKSKLK